MHRRREWLLLAVIFSSIAVGVFFPRAGRLFAPLPVYCMMILLFLSFLSIRLGDVWEAFRTGLSTLVWMVSVKLLVLPALVFLLFREVWPEYALGALLVSGISTGVVSPFFAALLQANSPFVLVMVVATSVAVPFTLPLLVHGFVGRTMDLSLLSMLRLLAMVIFVPLAVAETWRRLSPTAVDAIHSRRYPVSLVLFAVTNLGIFSKYSAFFLERPGTVLEALAVSVGLAAIYFASGLMLSWGRPVADQLSAVISFGLMNNVLVVVFSAQFFGPIEPTLAAMYTIPFFSLIIPLRLYRDQRLRTEIPGRWRPFS